MNLLKFQEERPGALSLPFIWTLHLSLYASVSSSVIWHYHLTVIVRVKWDHIYAYIFVYLYVCVFIFKCSIENKFFIKLRWKFFIVFFSFLNNVFLRLISWESMPPSPISLVRLCLKILTCQYYVCFPICSFFPNLFSLLVKHKDVKWRSGQRKYYIHKTCFFINS